MYKFYETEPVDSLINIKLSLYCPLNALWGFSMCMFLAKPVSLMYTFRFISANILHLYYVGLTLFLSPFIYVWHIKVIFRIIFWVPHDHWNQDFTFPWSKPPNQGGQVQTYYVVWTLKWVVSSCFFQWTSIYNNNLLLHHRYIQIYNKDIDEKCKVRTKQ